MQINYRNVQLIISLISNILLEVVLYIAFIILRFNIMLLSSIKIK
jgi:hypothetical protein